MKNVLSKEKDMESPYLLAIKTSIFHDCYCNNNKSCCMTYVPDIPNILK